MPACACVYMRKHISPHASLLRAGAASPVPSSGSVTAAKADRHSCVWLHLGSCLPLLPHSSFSLCALFNMDSRQLFVSQVSRCWCGRRACFATSARLTRRKGARRTPFLLARIPETHDPEESSVLIRSVVLVCSLDGKPANSLAPVVPCPSAVAPCMPCT